MAYFHVYQKNQKVFLAKNDSTHIFATIMKQISINTQWWWHTNLTGVL